jgi:pimeloyl-ACP methyl ester carboxylesterase
VVGHSWGGALATFYAAAYPERIERLIVYSGGPEDTALNDAKVAAHEAKLTEEERAQFEDGRTALVDAVQSDAPQHRVDLEHRRETRSMARHRREDGRSRRRARAG